MKEAGKAAGGLFEETAQMCEPATLYLEASWIGWILTAL